MKPTQLLLRAAACTGLLAAPYCLLATGEETQNTGTILWTNPAGWTSANIPGPADVAVINSGIVTINGSVTTGAFRLGGGALKGGTDLATDTLNLTGTFLDSRWTSGSITDLSVFLGSGSSLEISGASAKTFDRSLITNSGSIDWSGGNLITGNGGGITNTATGYFQDHNGASTSLAASFGGVGTFTNLGTYEKSGAGTTTISTVFNNSGWLDIDAGTLVLNGGGTMDSAGSISLDDDASLVFAGNYTVADAGNLSGSGTYSLVSGVLTLDGYLAVDLHQTGGFLAGTHTFAGETTWSSGSWNAAAPGSVTTIDYYGTLLLDTTASKTFDQRIIANEGLMYWTGGNLITGNGGGIENRSSGNFHDGNSGNFSLDAGFGGTATFTNDGRYLKDGSGTTILGLIFNNTGTLEVDAGTLVLNGTGSNGPTGTIEVASGAELKFTTNFTIADAATLAGDGAYTLTAGILTLDGSVNVGFSQIGGNLRGTQTFHSAFEWTGGNWNAPAVGGTTTFSSDGSLTITGASAKAFDKRIVENEGQILWSGGHLSSGNGGGINNRLTGVFRDANVTNVSLDNSYGGIATFNNEGEYRKEGSGTTNITAAFNNTGTVEVEAGTLIFTGTGTNASTGFITVADGANLQFNSNFTVADAAHLSGPGNYTLTSGILTLDGALGVGFTQTGGVLRGTHTFLDHYVWSSGNWNAPAAGSVTTVSSDGTLTMNSASAKAFDKRIIENQGQVQWSGGNLSSGNGGGITNRDDATFTDATSATASIDKSFGGSAAFINEGVYSKTGDSTTTIGMTFANSGTVDLTAGTLVLSGTGTSSATGSFHVSDGATLQFNSDFVVADASLLTGLGAFQLTSGTLTLDGHLGVGFAQSGGTLAGSPVLDHSYTWSGGNWSTASDGFTTTISSDGTLVVAGSASKGFNRRTIVNEGLFHWTAGSLVTGNGGGITNLADGVFHDALSNAYSLDSSFGGSGTFTNAGTYLKDGTGTTSIGLALNHTGTLQIDAGILILNGTGGIGADASVTIASGAELRFQSNYDVADAAALSGAGLYSLTAGILNLTGDLHGDFTQTGGTIEGTHTLHGDYLWSGGSFNAATDGHSTTIAETGVLSLTGTGAKSFNRRELHNTGTIHWQGGALITGNDGGINNAASGLFLDDNTGNVTLSAGFGGTSFFNHSGTYHKTGPGETRIDVPFAQMDSAATEIESGRLVLNHHATFAAGGSVDLSASSELVLAAGNAALADAGILTGDGNLRIEGANTTLIGSLDVATTLQSGSLGGDFVVTRGLEVTGGSINAGTSIVLAGSEDQMAYALLQHAGLSLNDVTFDIAAFAELIWRDGNLFAEDGGITVAGSLVAQGDNAFSRSSPGSETLLHIVNGGEFRKEDSSGTTTLAVPVYVDAGGSLALLSGTLELSHGGLIQGTITNPSGTTLVIQNGLDFDHGSFLESGDVLFQGGSSVLNGPVGLGQSTFYGGTIGGTHSLAGSITLLGGEFTADGTTTIEPYGLLNFGNISGQSLDRTIINHGTIAWNAGDLTGSGGGVLHNEGTFQITHDGTFSAGSVDYAFENSGVLIKSDGDGTTTLNLPVANHGTISVQTGSLAFGSTYSGDGSIALGGGSVSFTDTVSLGTSSVLAGNGTLIGDFDVAGIVSPGASIGALSIDGDLTLFSTSVSFFEIDVTAMPSPADYLAVSGTLTLDGLLSIDLMLDTLPVVTDTFTLYSAGLLVGGFSNVAPGERVYGPSLDYSFTVHYGPGSSFGETSVVLADFDFTPVPEPSTWALLLTGLGAVAVHHVRRRRRG